jgi:hypothetical protein
MPSCCSGHSWLRSAATLDGDTLHPSTKREHLPRQRQRVPPSSSSFSSAAAKRWGLLQSGRRRGKACPRAAHASCKAGCCKGPTPELLLVPQGGRRVTAKPNAGGAMGHSRCYMRPPTLLRAGAAVATSRRRRCYIRSPQLLLEVAGLATRGCRRRFLLPAAAGPATKGRRPCCKEVVGVVPTGGGGCC